MPLRRIVLAVLIVWPFAAQADEVDHGKVADRIEQLVEKNFYDRKRAEAFDAAPLRAEGLSPAEFDKAAADALAGLGVSHTGRYTSDRIDYFELLDIFRFAVRNDLRRIFPPRGQVGYAGIGMIAAEIEGRRFVTDVYHGGSAARAGVREGDEVLAADGEPYREIASFEKKLGKTVTLTLRREENAEPVEVPVKVEAIRPNELFTASISESIRTIESGKFKIGYMRIWSFTSTETRQLINDELGTGRLAGADALVLDLRSRWGGAPLDAAEVFVGRTPPTELKKRDGSIASGNTRWRKPVVAIIDEGTRSGLEVFAYALKVNDIPLVGTSTAGAVLAGTAYMLPDDSLLILAVQDVVTDGERIEGVGISPTREVGRDVRFENGNDPQLAAAIEMARERLASASNVESAAE